MSVPHNQYQSIHQSLCNLTARAKKHIYSKVAATPHKLTQIDRRINIFPKYTFLIKTSLVESDIGTTILKRRSFKEAGFLVAVPIPCFIFYASCASIVLLVG